MWVSAHLFLLGAAHLQGAGTSCAFRSAPPPAKGQPGEKPPATPQLHSLVGPIQLGGSSARGGHTLHFLTPVGIILVVTVTGPFGQRVGVVGTLADLHHLGLEAGAQAGLEEDGVLLAVCSSRAGPSSSHWALPPPPCRFLAEFPQEAPKEGPEELLGMSPSQPSPGPALSGGPCLGVGAAALLTWMEYMVLYWLRKGLILLPGWVQLAQASISLAFEEETAGALLRSGEQPQSSSQGAGRGGEPRDERPPPPQAPSSPSCKGRLLPEV